MNHARATLRAFAFAAREGGVELEDAWFALNSKQQAELASESALAARICAQYARRQQESRRATAWIERNGILHSTIYIQVQLPPLKPVSAVSAVSAATVRVAAAVLGGRRGGAGTLRAAQSTLP